MKTQIKTGLWAIMILLLTSCGPTIYFQVYQVAPGDKMKSNENSLIYEDDNCIVSYNLWAERGDIGFKVYNKTNSNIYVNLEESFFILNGIAHDYFKNRVYSFAAGSYSEDNIICIPPKAAKMVAEYNINETIYRDCDLYRFPARQKYIKTKSFTKDDSPIVFGNRIAYSLGEYSNLIRCENLFYVSEITNYPMGDMIGYKSDEFCGKKSFMYQYFKLAAPNRFFVKYLKVKMFGNDKH